MDQLDLFPLSALKRAGYAQPEPRDADIETEDVDEAEAEAA